MSERLVRDLLDAVEAMQEVCLDQVVQARGRADRRAVVLWQYRADRLHGLLVRADREQVTA
jgi:xanthine/CO dehydrogenase XdhC/CoxF family maturation factor